MKDALRRAKIMCKEIHGIMQNGVFHNAGFSNIYGISAVDVKVLCYLIACHFFLCCCKNQAELRLKKKLMHALVSLEELTLIDYPSLEFIPITTQSQGMSCLCKLKIENCEKLSSWPSGLEYCTSLQELHIENCQNLRYLPVDGLQTLVSLEELTLIDCPSLEFIPSTTQSQGMPCLRILKIEKCEKLSSWPSGLDNLTFLRELSICGCDGLTSLPRGLQSCTSLRHLEIWKCHNLISLADVDDISRLQSLSNLEIFDCRKLKYLPTGLRSLTSLEYMRIGNFWEELDSFPDFELPSQIQELLISGWPKLKSLPQQI